MPSHRAPTWFRGQLHAHSYWSDGRAFPEQAIEAYRQRGYAFLCLSEHNRFADDPAAWRPVEAEEGRWPPKVSQPIFDDYVRTFGKDWVETRTEGSQTHVRLKTYEQLKQRFEEPGRFLLLPGAEITQQLANRHLHLNYINLPTLLPSLADAPLVKPLADTPVRDIIAANVEEVRQAAEDHGAPHLMMANHPFTFFCDVLPEDLIDSPEVRFFEICNNGAYHIPPPETAAYTSEMFWDAVNTMRCMRNQPLLYGVGSDDAHFYDEQRCTERGGVGDAWVMVRSPALTPRDLIEAMHRGDFYATCGVLLDEVIFSPADRTLRVKVRAEPGVRYRIHFITTKRDADTRVTEVPSPPEGKRPERTLPIYSDDIGRIVDTVEGAEGAYRLQPDDLYVRARIESDLPSQVTDPYHPTVKTAWTQPYHN